MRVEDQNWNYDNMGVHCKKLRTDGVLPKAEENSGGVMNGSKFETLATLRSCLTSNDGQTNESNKIKNLVKTLSEMRQLS